MKIEPILAIIVGLALFLSDLAYGWLTMISGPIPVIFIIAIVVGIIARGVGQALLCTLATWTLGLLIGTLLAPYILSSIVSPTESYVSVFIKVLIWSIRGMFTFTYEGNLIEVIVLGLLYLVMMMIVAPIVYAMSFIFSVLGGIIGNILRGTRKKPEAVSQPPADAPIEPQ